MITLQRYIRQLSKEDFEKYKTNLIIHSKEPELDDIADALWKENFTELYDFDQQETEKKYIERMEQEELVTFYEVMFYFVSYYLFCEL